MSMIDVDVGDAITILDERLYEVEMLVTGEDVMTGPQTNVFPSGIQVGTNAGVGDPLADLTIIYAAPVPPPTNLTLTPGDHFDNLYVDLDWDAPVGLGDDQVQSYDVEVSQKIAGVYGLPRTYRNGGVTNLRIERLEPNQTYGFRVFAVDQLNRRSTPLGDAGNGPTFYKDQAIGTDTTIPPAVANVQLSAGFKTIVVRWDETGQPVDVAEGVGTYRVQVSDTAAFTPGAGTETKITTSTIVSFGPYASSVTKFARVQAVDQSGNDGPYVNSTPASVTTQQADGIADITVGTINSDHIVTVGLDAAVIKFGEMDGDRIDVNTLNANRLKSSAITAANIEILGGMIASDLSVPEGFVLSAQGFSLYDTSGVRTVFLDAETGQASFTGTITSGSTITGATFQTAVSGQRIKITSPPSFNGIEFYTGHGSETLPAKIIGFVDSGAPKLRIEGPRLSGGSAPQPYIDLIGNAGTIGTIAGWAGTDISWTAVGGAYLRGSGGASLESSGGNVTIDAGNTLLFRKSGADMEYIDASGNHIVGNLWMHDRPIWLRGNPDTNHGLYWTNSPSDQTVLISFAQLTFAINGFIEGYFTSTGLYVQEYVTAYGGTARLGEVYGRAGLLANSGHLQIDSNGGDLYLRKANVAKMTISGSYVHFHQEATLDQNSLFLRIAGDNNHRMYYHSGFDGDILQGYIMAGIASTNYDVMSEAGHYGTTVRSVNLATTAFRDHDAGFHWDLSDPVAKKNLVGLKNEDKWLDKVKAIKPVKFQWKKDQGSDEAFHLSFDSTTLPPEVTKQAMLQEGVEMTMLSPTSMIAMLWQAVHELEAQVSTLTAAAKLK